MVVASAQSGASDSLTHRTYSDVLFELVRDGAYAVGQLARRLTWVDLGFVMVLLVLLLYRKSIRSLIERVVTLRGGGIELAVREPPAQTPGSVSDELRARVSKSPVIEAELRTIEDVLRRANTPTFEAALEMAAVFSVGAQFEWLLHLIYGSQLALLQELQRTANSRLLRDVVERDYYKPSLSRWPSTPPTFEQWLQFIIDQRLVSVLGDGSVTLERRGEEFVKQVEAVHPGYVKLF
jgi:hypothetical protein